MTGQLITKKFKSFFSALETLKVKDLPYHPEVRSLLFSLEAILRLHIKGQAFNSDHTKVLEKCLAKLKDMEDALGAFSYAVEIRDYYHQHYKKDDKVLKKNIQYNKKLFKKHLSHRVSGLKKVESKLSKITWPKAAEFIPLAIDMEVKRIKEKNETKLKPLIFKKKYTDYEIQEGLHEWRRMLRWVSIYYQAYPDLFTLNPEQPKNNEAKELKRQYLKDPFCILGPEKAKNKLSSLAFYQLSDYIKRLGDLKSSAEIPRTLNELGLKVPLTFKERQAQSIYRHYEKSKVLEKLKS